MPWWNSDPAIEMNFVRACILVALITDFGALMFKLFGTEVIEFSQGTLALTKEIRGWERRREYPVVECRERQWDEGRRAAGHKVQGGRKMDSFWRRTY